MRLDLRDFERRDGEVVLNGDVVDHQLVDVDGVRVVRASDLYLARVAGVYRLVGVDVGFQTLLRRLGPTALARPAHARARHRLGARSSRSARRAACGPDRCGCTRRTRRCAGCGPAELADLLEELGREERQELLDQLDREIAADALEEMDPEELGTLLRESEPDRAAALLAEMEPDEAADALRDLEPDRAEELLGDHAAGESRRRCASCCSTARARPAALMTTNLVLVRPSQTVGEVRRILRAQAEHQADVDAVIIVDDDGRRRCTTSGCSSCSSRRATTRSSTSPGRPSR